MHPPRLVWLMLAAALSLGSALELAGSRIPTTIIRGSEYVSLKDVVRALKGRCWQVGYRVVVLLPSDSGGPSAEMIFRPESTVAVLADRRVNMVLPAVLADSELNLPAMALLDLFPGSEPVFVRSLDVAHRGDTVVLIMSTRPAHEDTGTAANGRARSKPATGRDSPICYGETRSSLEYRLAIGATLDPGVIEQLKLLPMTGAGPIKTVEIETGASATLRLAFLQPTAVQLASTENRVELRISARPMRKISRIVLDPGHGGKDPGAVGRGGTQEKNVVLDIAHRLRRKLQAQGFEVIVTRNADDYVSLAERSKCGNGTKADLFVSIHANATIKRAICGFETYFLSDAKTDWERAVAARENAALDEDDGDPAGTAPGDLGLILADLAQSEFLWESSDLAAKIQESTVPRARIRNRGVRQANFYVLRNNFMPAVLVECGFLSNRSEEKLLKTQKHREKLAEGICRGITAYARQYVQKANGHAPQADTGKPGTAGQRQAAKGKKSK
jgi:N-acetylmuramoyl-L-alanine amidase